MLWVKAYDRYVPFFSKWMTCMKVISIRNLDPLKYVRKINEGGYVKTKRVF
jgi:hypothetical protein